MNIKKPFVMIPTYNEKENIRNLIDKLLKLKIENMNIVVVDDNSPDGTSSIVNEISKENKKVHLILRKKDKGRGLAGKAGFIYALANGADVVIEMDADMSHHPKYIPEMLKELNDYDLVLGSRRVKGANEVGRGIFRRFVTWGANLYITLMLGIKVKDCNSGFRCFRREALEKIDVKKLSSKGPSTVQEILFKTHLKGLKIKEIPITFVNRTKGRSKLGLSQLASGYFMILKLKIQHMIGMF
jgi:dolichol-phosphate mannosyltransferase